MDTATGEVTELLRAWKGGRPEALDDAVALIHQELKRLASALMRGERAGHTLQTSALVNEAYVRLAEAPGIEIQDRNHFYSIASRVMRRVLVDYAREHRALKRGGESVRVELDEAMLSIPGLPTADMVDLDRALEELEEIDERKTKIVELRFFAGLTNQETAYVLGCSLATVKRDWEFTRVWLKRALEDGV